MTKTIARKFNADRAADRATIRTGQRHTIRAVAGGYQVVPVVPTQPATIAAALTKRPRSAPRRTIQSPAPAKASRKRVSAPNAEAVRAAAPSVAGKARAVIVAACTRPEGATGKELFDATAWKYASWSHQLKLASKATGLGHEIRKVDGVTRYFLTEA